MLYLILILVLFCHCYGEGLWEFVIVVIAVIEDVILTYLAHILDIPIPITIELRMYQVSYLFTFLPGIDQLKL